MVKSIVDILLSHQGEKNFPILKLKIRQPPSRGYQLKSHLIKSISPLIPPSEKFNFPHLEITTMNDGVEQVTTVVASGFLHQIGVVDQDMKTRALVLTKFGQELVERYTKE